MNAGQIFILTVFGIACSSPKTETTGTSTTSSPSTTGEHSGTSEHTGTTDSSEMVSVFPDAESTWSGTAELNGTPQPVEVVVERDNSRLTGTVAFDILGTIYSFAVVGHVDLATGAVSVAPGNWIGANPGLEVVGLIATFDATTGALEGTLIDTLSVSDPEARVGAFSATTTSALAEVDAAELAETYRLDTPATLSGTFQCTGSVRPMTGTLSRGADGFVTGTLSFTEPDGSPVGGFAVQGVEAGGGITLQPREWTEYDGAATVYANFWMDGAIDEDSIVGTLHQNTGSPCNVDAVNLSLE